ncbi:MAG: hypothetical protein HOQ05_04655 [Corynebacteriales bacterium]|nr:hypothetical protein [Mycobacteriales bacterium]
MNKSVRKSWVVPLVSGIVVLALVLGGAFWWLGRDDSDSSSDRSEKSAPTSPDVVAPSMPEYPAAATARTEDGARAALQYEVDLLHYVQQTGDVAALEQIYDYEYCTGCAAIRDALAATLANDNRIKGGTYTITNIHFVAFEVPATDGGEPYWLVEMSHMRTASAQVAPNGTSVNEDPGEEGTLNLQITFRNGKWVVHSLSVKSS